MYYPSFPSSKAYLNRPNDFKGPQKFGLNNENNYLLIEEDGTPSLHGDATGWEDLRFPATQLRVNPTINKPVFDFVNVGYLFDSETTETLFMLAQMPHSWKEGSSIEPHIHWQPSTTTIGNVLWQLEYKWTNVNDVESGSWQIISVLSPTSEITLKHQISSFGLIPANDKKISSILTMKLSRIGGDVSDSYNADTILKEFDIHYEIDMIGSRQPYIKNN
jgi:hypothetical protein